MLIRINHTTKSLLLGVLTLVSITGILSVATENLLPVNPILELSFFLFSIFFIYRASNAALSIQIIFLIYVAGSYFYMISAGKYGGIKDFLMIYKSFIYFVFLMGFSGKKVFNQTDIEKIFKMVLYFFLAKYIIWVFLGQTDRPGIYGENNFELVFLLILYVLNVSFSDKDNFLHIALLAIIFILSGSRSACACLLAVITFTNLQRINGKMLLGLMCSGVIACGAVYVFISRMDGQGIESIDRFRFLQFFLNDIESWTMIHYLFGFEPITPMSQYSCDGLAYYSKLFSSHRPDTCYSVILHSFILRTLYDHGLIGLFVLLFALNYGLTRSGFSWKNRSAIVGIVILSGLSVSALNSIFVCLGLMLCFATSIPSKQAVTGNTDTPLPRLSFIRQMVLLNRLKA